MKLSFKYCLGLCALLVMTACSHHEDEPIKPAEERTVLFLTNRGEIYNQHHELVCQLPKCDYASQIISDKNDYFVSGTNQNERVGYWKNGKWNTLHVDFIDDVDHWIDGIGKWEYYIYLLDYPNVLKNSGIFPLERADEFIPAYMAALAVSEGNCFVVGQLRNNVTGSGYLPAMYHEHKGRFTPEYLPVPDGTLDGYCSGIYAYNGTHTLVGGSVDGWPAIWVDKQLQILPLTELVYEDYVNQNVPLGVVVSLTECEGEVYAVGSEPLGDHPFVATMWHNGVIEHLIHDAESDASEALKVMTYGSDFYVVTLEYNLGDDGEYVTTTVLWKNGEFVKAYYNLATISFTIV